jgi:Uma2 family endonuclease
MARTARKRFNNLAELLEWLGNPALWRVRMDPPPCRSSEHDALLLRGETGRPFELVDGTVVEKVVGGPESALARRIIHLVGIFLDEYDLGHVTGTDYPVRLRPGLLRMPDVFFVSWDQLRRREWLPEPAHDLRPDLAVEVLRKGSAAESQRKVKEYHRCGTRLVWLVDPRKRNVTVFRGRRKPAVFTEQQILTGEPVFPGLVLSVEDIFDALPRRRPARAPVTPPPSPSSPPSPPARWTAATPSLP